MLHTKYKFRTFFVIGKSFSKGKQYKLNYKTKKGFEFQFLCILSPILDQSPKIFVMTESQALGNINMFVEVFSVNFVN